MKLHKGETFTATVVWVDAADLTTPVPVHVTTWRSTNPRVAIVTGIDSTHAIVTATGLGRTTIRAFTVDQNGKKTSSEACRLLVIRRGPRKKKADLIDDYFAARPSDFVAAPPKVPREVFDCLDKLQAALDKLTGAAKVRQ